MKWESLPFDTPGPDGYYRWSRTTLHVHLLGTNHPHEWHSHKPSSTGRIKTPVGRVHRDYYYAAVRVAEWIQGQTPAALRITGHSYGWAVAEIVAALVPNAYLVTYGGVKAGRLTREPVPAIHYRHRGDVVPWWPLWPWYRRKAPSQRVGKWMLPWEAHKIESYREATGARIP